jgi:hypothetical protein
MSDTPTSTNPTMARDDKRAYILMGAFVLMVAVAAVSGPIAREYRRQFPVTTFDLQIEQGGFTCNYKVVPNGYGSEIVTPVDPNCDKPKPKRKR